MVVQPHHQMTPLHVAAKNAHIEIMEHLLKKNADINIQDNKGVSTSTSAY